MPDDKVEPSAPYGVSDEGAPPKVKNPVTGEPSTPYGDVGAGTSGGLPSDVEPDPSQQPG